VSRTISGGSEQNDSSERLITFAALESPSISKGANGRLLIVSWEGIEKISQTGVVYKIALTHLSVKDAIYFFRDLQG